MLCAQAPMKRVSKETKVRTTEKSEVVFKLGLLLFLMCLLTSLVFGQEKAGEINGIVTDETGAVLTGVSVTVTNSVTNRLQIVFTGNNGAYRARPLEPGRYKVQFELSRFAPTEFVDVNV